MLLIKKCGIIAFMGIMSTIGHSQSNLLDGEFVIDDSYVLDSLNCTDYSKLTYRFKTTEFLKNNTIYDLNFFMVFTDRDLKYEDRNYADEWGGLDNSFNTYSSSNYVSNWRNENGYVLYDIIDDSKEKPSPFTYKIPTFGRTEMFKKEHLHDAGNKRFERNMQMYVFVQVIYKAGEKEVTQYEGDRLVTRKVPIKRKKLVGDSQGIPVKFKPVNIKKYQKKNPDFKAGDLNCNYQNKQRAKNIDRSGSASGN